MKKPSTCCARSGTPERVPEYVQGVKDRKYRLMGFGHRVYKNYDPRAKVMQETCHEVLEAVGDANDPLLQVAMELEKIALSDDYFISRKLYPNIDFYSGITLNAMGFPSEMFTVLFALARTVGWVSQWQEMIADPQQKIGRPRQLYTGPALRDFVPVEKRGFEDSRCRTRWQSCSAGSSARGRSPASAAVCTRGPPAVAGAQQGQGSGLIGDLSCPQLRIVQALGQGRGQFRPVAMFLDELGDHGAV